ncbi:unnamed protein product, partial [Didymodactylos carnosus]
LEYFLKWVGYDDSENKWIRAEDLNCPNLIAKFEAEKEQKRRDNYAQRIGKRKSNPPSASKRPSKKQKIKTVENNFEEEEQSNSNISTSVSLTTTVKAAKSSKNTTKKSSKTEEQVQEQSSSDIQTDQHRYGVEKGYEVQSVLGVNRQEKKLNYVVHYMPNTPIEDKMELLPSHVASKYCPEQLIRFFQTRIRWKNHP